MTDADFNKPTIPSLSGPQVPIWLPLGLGISDPREIGRALIAWRYTLTPDQVATLELLAQGLTNDQLGVALGLSEITSVKNRVQAILDKLKVRNRTQAAVIAARYGLANSETAEQEDS